MAQVGYIRIKFIPRMVFGTQDLNNQRDGYREKDNSNETCRKKDLFFSSYFYPLRLLHKHDCNCKS